MKRTTCFLTIFSGLALGLTGCKTNDVYIINTPPPVTSTTKTTKTEVSRPSVTRPQGKTDPTGIEPVKAPSTFSNP